MSTIQGTVATNHSLRNLDNKHLLCGSGGSRAILGSAGAILALSKAGHNDWRSMGGVSGGSIPSLFIAAGWPAGKMVKLAVDIDFASLLSRRTNIFMTFLAFLLKERLAQTRPRRAVMGSEKLGDFIDKLVTAWPEKYWTMAVAGKTQVIFTSKGVFQYLEDGTVRQVSAHPAPLGLAIRASCAVPGIIEPAQYNGVYLFDGALSNDGQCPIGVVVNHFKSQANEVVACDVGDREAGYWSRFVNNFWRVFCGNHCVWPKDEKTPTLWQAEGSMVITPAVNQFPSLQFTLTAEQKWGAVIAGYVAALTELKTAGLLDEARFAELSAPTVNISAFQAICET
ncbi:MAG: patatin-like phospholipase family protein [Candidatus Obscuribacterales bacterium]|nr:patatin-like phospholipase family protein [Candidatus Obscuribacterales bacterium]